MYVGSGHSSIRRPQSSAVFFLGLQQSLYHRRARTLRLANHSLSCDPRARRQATTTDHTRRRRSFTRRPTTHCLYNAAARAISRSQRTAGRELLPRVGLTTAVVSHYEFISNGATGWWRSTTTTYSNGGPKTIDNRAYASRRCSSCRNHARSPSHRFRQLSTAPINWRLVAPSPINDAHLFTPFLRLDPTSVQKG